MNTSVKRMVRCSECYCLSVKGDTCDQCGMPLKPALDMTRQELQRKIREDIDTKRLK